MNVVNFLELLCLITGLALIKKINAGFLFIVIILISYSTLNEIAAYFYSVSTSGKTNIFFYIIYAVLSFPLFLLIIKSIVKNNTVKHIITLVIVVLVMCFCIEISISSELKKYPFNSMSAGCILISFFCFQALTEILNDDGIYNIKYESAFWFLTGTLFFHLLLLTYIFIHNFVSLKEIQIFNKYLITVGNLIFYPFTTIAFLCQLKKEK